MKIDVHSHFVPESARRSAERDADWHGVRMFRSETGALMGNAEGADFDLPEWTANAESLEQRLALLDTLRLDAQVLAIAPRLQRYRADPAAAVNLARDMNDDLAALTAAQPKRIGGLVHLPLQDPAASIVELERMAGKPGIIGAAVGSNVRGEPWDSTALFPVLQAVQDLNLILFVHPADRPKDPRTKRFHLNNLIGNPLETTFAVAALIFGGVLDRLTDIKVCFAHGGGYAVLGSGRFDAGYKARPDVRESAALLPTDYLKRLYYDSITFSERALRHLADVVGASQILLGSDYPADMGDGDPVGFVEGCQSLSAGEKEAILGGNLRRISGAFG